MDKFRVRFRCITTPKPYTGLNGFEQGVIYQGRKYNGLFEVSVKWGSGAQTKIIERNLFDEFFEEITEDEFRNIKNQGNVPVCVEPG